MNLSESLLKPVFFEKIAERGAAQRAHESATGHQTWDWDTEYRFVMARCQQCAWRYTWHGDPTATLQR